MSSDVYVWSLDGCLCMWYVCGFNATFKEWKAEKDYVKHSNQDVEITHKLLSTNVHGALDK